MWWCVHLVSSNYGRIASIYLFAFWTWPPFYDVIGNNSSPICQTQIFFKGLLQWSTRHIRWIYLNLGVKSPGGGSMFVFCLSVIILLRSPAGQIVWSVKMLSRPWEVVHAPLHFVSGSRGGLRAWFRVQNFPLWNSLENFQISISHTVHPRTKMSKIRTDHQWAHRRDPSQEIWSKPEIVYFSDST